jgi:hypothetical protein
MSPLPGASIFHPLFSQHHRPSVKTSMQSKCKVLRKGVGDPIFDPDTGDTIPPDDVVVYDGPCRVQELQREAQRIWAGDQGLSRETYLVSIDINLLGTNEVRAGEFEDWVIFYENPADPQLLDFRMSVEHVQVGTHVWERDLICWADTSRQTGA